MDSKLKDFLANTILLAVGWTFILYIRQALSDWTILISLRNLILITLISLLIAPNWYVLLRKVYPHMTLKKKNAYWLLNTLAVLAFVFVPLALLPLKQVRPDLAIPGIWLLFAFLFVDAIMLFWLVWSTIKTYDMKVVPVSLRNLKMK